MTEPKRQQTQPKKGEPLEIPVPKRAEFERLLKKAAEPKRPASPRSRGKGGRRVPWRG